MTRISYNEFRGAFKALAAHGSQGCTARGRRMNYGSAACTCIMRAAEW